MQRCCITLRGGLAMMARSKKSLTPTEAAIIDLERQEEAIAARRKALGLDPAVPVVPTDAQNDMRMAPDHVIELTRPVRLDIPFDDPVATRDLLGMLMRAFEEAQAISQDHGLGPIRQRMRMRETVKIAANLVVLARGMKPRGWRGSDIDRR